MSGRALWNTLLETEKERDALKADAERYRWLRSKFYAGWLGQIEMGERVIPPPGPWNDATLDAAIDAAIRASVPQPGILS